MDRNIIEATDSYKWTHHLQYPRGTQGVYSYFESRVGATYPNTVFFGLQYILKEYLVGSVVNMDMLNRADLLSNSHFNNPDIFNWDGWKHIVQDHGGRIPVRIRAVPEGLVIPQDNILMNVENTCWKCFWVTNAIESLLTHLWYPSTVATLSYHVKLMMAEALRDTADTMDALPFMLHDFGYRGAASHESAAIGGAGHLVNFMGTDTIPAMRLAMDYYGAKDVAFSVPATEHSVMTALGRDDEFEVVEDIIDRFPTGILSMVADSYNIYQFVETIGTKYRDKILARDGKFVVRPDSKTVPHPTPAKLVIWILERLYTHFGGRQNSKGYTVLNPKVGGIWGDGLEPATIKEILVEMKLAGFSAENLVFGMGGGLLQKVDRDRQRFAFKSSAQARNGFWYDVSKDPLDSSKKSKAGRLRLIQENGQYKTTLEGLARENKDVLTTVFEDGKLKKEYSFEEIRKNAGAAFL